MLKNYIKIAWRNLVKQRLFSLINITGLAIGLAVCIMIMMYVAHEMSYDSFHKDADRIFTPRIAVKMGGNSLNMDHMSYVSAPMIKQRQPVVDDYTRTLVYPKPIIVSDPRSPSEKFTETKLLFADANFFNFFDFKLLSGGAKKILDKPFTVILSKAIARKYFGDSDPVGKTITLKTDSAYNYQVVGVAENSPSNSSITYNFITSNLSLLAMKQARDYVGDKQIGFGRFDVYFRLNHATDSATLRRGLDQMARQDKMFEGGVTYSLAPLPDIHLKSNFGSDGSNNKYLKIFPLVALLILLLALVNYMSLSTAKATLRAREVGVRKVVGAGRKTIALQFYVESALFAVLSFILGYALCYAFKPWFLNVLQLNIDDTFLYSPVVLTSLFALLVLTVIIAGSYPSFVLSAFKPVTTLKGKMSKAAGGVLVRKVFTTLQFAISVGLIICGIVIDRQLYFFRHTDTGMDRDNVVMIPVGSNFGGHYATFKQEVAAIPGVTDVATSHYAMFKGYDMFFVDGKTEADKVPLASMVTDSHFVSTLGLKWKYPPFANTDLTGSHKIVINETAAAQLHLPGNPVGKFVKNGDEMLEITGVLKDFNFSSMEGDIKSLALNIAADTAKYYTKRGCNLFAKINAHTNVPTVMSKMGGIFKKYDPETAFTYTFLDDAFNEQYKAEDRLASIFSVFTGITIMLATLGLFGLAAFTIEQRSKEIGIRKVLGASVASINAMLSRNFLMLVLLAIAIASPIAWWAMHDWLQGFAYRITISWWMFAIAGAIAVLTALITVSYHAIKAALANPINSLKSE